MTTLRSLLFLLGSIPITTVFGILVPLGGLFGVHVAAAFARNYTKVMLVWVEWSLGISYEVQGWENVPPGPVMWTARPSRLSPVWSRIESTAGAIRSQPFSSMVIGT